MSPFFEQLSARAATIDELLSDQFEPLPGQKSDADAAARRLAAWCRSCASGDWLLFERRLGRDGLSIGQVLARLATVRQSASAPTPRWVEDAIWIEAALQSPGDGSNSVAAGQIARHPFEPCAFEHLFSAVIEQADTKLWASVDARAAGNLTESARVDLRYSLLKELSGLCAPAIYERFAKARSARESSADAGDPQGANGPPHYDRFVANMKMGGFHRLFEEKPVLLRLVAVITRQWMDTSRELVMRLDADLANLRRELLHSAGGSRVVKIEGNLSDPHNGGHTVLIARFEDDSRIVYKPKDLRLDEAWCALIERLNRAAPPVTLKAARAIVRAGYGWTEFISHTDCADADGCRRFFRRAGAWLALFHCFAGTDMHQENMIAAHDHPVPIDLEMLLQAAAAGEHQSEGQEAQACEAAEKIVHDSVVTVGLLPAYGRSPENSILAMGGMTSDWSAGTKLVWRDINSDNMRPARAKQAGETTPNLPHVAGRYAKLGDHIDDFISGFEDYARFLSRRDAMDAGLFDGFAGLSVRKVIRPSNFYYMLLQRLRNHRTMDDGVIWSAQADFLARLADWEKHADPLWPLQRAERAALLALNVPHFVSPSDGNEISDATTAISVRLDAPAGLDRARGRVQGLDEQEIAWQVEVVRQSVVTVSRSAGPAWGDGQPKQLARAEQTAVPTPDLFLTEAANIAAELSGYAVRRGPGAAWIGLDWLGDSEVSQLASLGPDLYTGVSGIAVFFAANAAVTGDKPSEELALAAVAHLRRNLRGRNAARMARLLGTGGANGLGSIVYALAVISRSLQNQDLLADAHVAADLFTDDLIAADTQLDVMGGNAGGILGLLRLYRDTRSGDVLRRAAKCGEHLLAQSRVGREGRRSWSVRGFGHRALNGLSHGAAGFAYALASLAAATGREEFASAASECIAFENSSYDAEHRNWPDVRVHGEPHWSCQWCNGAPGIGLARMAMTKRGAPNGRLLETDVRNALAGVERGWPSQVDTLCCGTLGSIEFLGEAAGVLARNDLRELASRRLMAVLQTAAETGDYRWSAGKRQFNPGLFRGLAGVGYTALRQVDRSLPNILIWD